MNVRLLLVDDHPMMLDALARRLAEQPNYTVVGKSLTGELALNLALELKPDLVVMDVHLGNMNGIESARRILSALPGTRIVIFSSDAEDALVKEALKAGVRGYIFKQGSAEDLIRAIDEVMAGKIWLSPEVSAAIVEDDQGNLVGYPKPPKPILSPREKRLLRLISEGRRNKEIAVELELKPNSIETVRARLLKKISCRNTAEAVRYAIREGLAVA
jgi:DNA-binding NarL/FixJ family response regulator